MQTVSAQSEGPRQQPTETVEDEGGVLNPEELTVEFWARKSKEAHYDPKICYYGYISTKMGSHEPARQIFERCSEHGNLQTMPWSAWTEEMGYDRPSNPDAAAAWDKKLADAGEPLGKLNFGLDLLRGHGVKLDAKLGRDYVDQAAAGGDKTAKELAQQGYDPESVTPSADFGRYRHLQF